ncbi:hypothetical protein WJX81_005503 [Elliptochloris bilobata]|uniref:Uncharacterized protein n=1 Tax=Elliptochloris bilobata TaxID=381761 RepID=A0AAW1RNQ6_9CHLO
MASAVGGKAKIWIGRERSRCLPLPARLGRRTQVCPTVVSVLKHPGACTPRHQGLERETILCGHLKGHAAAVTAALVKVDADGKKEVITASLDKTMALWRLEAEEEGGELLGVRPQEVARLNPAGAPIFSLAVDGTAPEASASSPDSRQQVFCGNAAKSIGVWEPPAGVMQERVVLNGHAGWVRALAVEGRYLFSSGCSTLRQWDLTRAVPRHMRDVSLVKGDILGLATAPGRVFTAGADGAIRAWAVSKKGEMEAAGARDKAHRDRVTALVHAGGFLYSVSHDGTLKMWDAASLELVMEERAAHDGGRLHCAAAAADGHLYTGGDDKLVQRWRLGSLAPARAGALHCHNHSVRTLAAGPCETLVSGDAAGGLALWTV